MTNESADRSRRRFLTITTTVVGGVGVAFAAWPFLASWNPSAKAQAIGAPVEADVSKLEPGQKLTVQWRGKPVWVVRRTEADLEHLTSLNSQVRDPDSEVPQQPTYAKNEYRSIKPEFLVLVGLCTHLGCSPTHRPEAGGDLGPDWKGGFFCPCHGSRFDLAGRVYAGVPAPTNLEVPPHSFVSATTILIGVDQGAA